MQVSTSSNPSVKPATTTLNADPLRLRDLFSFHRPSLAQLILIAISLLVFAALLRWTLHDFPLAQVWHGFRTAHLGWLLLTLGALYSGQLLRCLRWQRLLVCDAPIQISNVGKSLMDGQMINWLSPVRLGDVWRAWQAMQTGERNGLWAAGSIVLEKSADSLVLALYALALLIVPLPVQTYTILFRLGLGGLAGMLVLGGLLALRPNAWHARALSRLPKNWQTHLASDRFTLPISVQKNIRKKSVWAELAAFSIGIWVFAVGVNVALAQSLGIHLTWVQQLFFILAIQLGLVLSTVPANIGLFPLVALGVFALFGLDQTQALTFGSVLYVLVYGVNITLWLGWALVAHAIRRVNKPDLAPPITHSLIDATDRVRDGIRIEVAGSAVDTDSFDSVLNQVIAHIQTGGAPTYLVTPNAARIVAQHQNPFLQKIYREALLSVPDGIAVVWAAHFLGTPVAGRVNGTDLFEALCACASQSDLRVMFVGWRPGAVDGAATILKKSHPSLNIVDMYCPSQAFEESPDEMAHMNARIIKAQPHLLFVGFGSPKEETWIYENYKTWGVPVSIGIGASFDFVSGVVKRAPVWMQKSGLEWFYRLVSEPSRLWRRYLVSNPQFILRVIHQKLTTSKKR